MTNKYKNQFYAWKNMEKTIILLYNYTSIS